MRGSIPEEYSHSSSGGRNNPCSLSLLYLTIEQVSLFISPPDTQSTLLIASSSVYSEEVRVEPTRVFTDRTETSGIIRAFSNSLISYLEKYRWFRLSIHRNA